MNRYKIGEQIYVAIDGQLFQALEPLQDISVAQRATTTPEIKHTQRGKGKRLSAEEIESMAQDSANGMTTTEIMLKYKVSRATVINKIREYTGKKKTGSGRRTSFQCEIGHRFVSNLAKLDARCPVCGSITIDYDVPTKVREE